MFNYRNYYFLIYYRFYRGKYDVVLKLEHRKDTEYDTLSSNIRIEENTTDLDCLVKYTKCKRDAKLLYKMHIAMLDEYLSLNSN